MQKDRNTIKRAYARACNDYLNQLLIDWGYYDNDEDGTRNFGWWVGDEVGGIYCIEDDTFINMDEIRFCVDNNVSQDTYTEYTNYCLRCSEYGFEVMNLKSYVSGAPRIPDESFDKLDSYKNTLQNAIEEVNKQFAKKESTTPT